MIKSYSNEELFELLINYHKQSKKNFSQIAQEVGLSRQQLNDFKMKYKNRSCQTANTKLNYFFGGEPSKKTVSGHPQIKDLSNQIFNNWLILKLDEEKTKQSQQATWICECLLCHKKYSVLGINITKELSKQCISCGLIQNYYKKIINPYPDYPGIEDLRGQKFNKLTVIDLDKEKTNQYKSNNSYCYWIVQCDCGSKPFSLVGHRLGETLSCGCLNSKGEYLIGKILTENNISYEREKIFDDCYLIDKEHPSRFDFYVDNKYIIEFDGFQHFSYDNNGWNNYENYIKTKERDKIKNEYCIKNSIPLIRIPYYLEKIEIKDLLLETSEYLYKGDDCYNN